MTSVSSSSNALQIYCRLRPPTVLNDEITKIVVHSGPTSNEKKVNKIERINDTTLTLRRANSFLEQQFLFEHVFEVHSRQEQVFEQVALPLVHSVIMGKNSLLFAYGVTSSGKSYTVNGLPTDPGIIPRALHQIYTLLQSRLDHQFLVLSNNQNNFFVEKKNPLQQQTIDDNDTDWFEQTLSVPFRKRYKQSVNEWLNQSCQLQDNSFVMYPILPTSIAPNKRFSIFVSFVEIYNNYVYDLLKKQDPQRMEAKRTPHQLRHDSKQAVYVHGVNEVEALNLHQAMKLYLYGQQNRSTAATALNQSSSRSHSVFSIKLVHLDEPTAQVITVSQMAIVDLAGVERARRTKNSGATLSEASSINNSLLTLRNCFDIMHKNQSLNKPLPIPYRQNKLTLLFKSFFEQPAQIRMIICLNPSTNDLDENIQVLGFGKKAQEIVIEEEEETLCEQTNLPIELETITSIDKHRISSFELNLTRFRMNQLNSYFDSNALITDLEHYLEVHITDGDKMCATLPSIMANLDRCCKAYPQRQLDQVSLNMPHYQLNLCASFDRMMAPLYKRQKRISCLHISEVANTPIVVAKPNWRARNDKLFPIKLTSQQELQRDLLLWETDNIDRNNRLRCIVERLAELVNKNLIVGDHRKLDVFTRLYYQTPARYKVNKPVKRLQGVCQNVTRRRESSSYIGGKTKVSMLKRLFSTPVVEQQQKQQQHRRYHHQLQQQQPNSNIKNSSVWRKGKTISMKIQNICKQLQQNKQ